MIVMFILSFLGREAQKKKSWKVSRVIEIAFLQNQNVEDNYEIHFSHCVGKS